MTSSVSAEYEYIIAGAGCAGLSLALRMIACPSFDGKRLLIVDTDPRPRDEKTWCFWEQEPGYFQQLVSAEWQQARVRADGFDRSLPLAPYKYKMIRGIDFFRHAFDALQRHPGVVLRKGKVEQTGTGGDHAWIRVNGRLSTGRFLFNSIAPPIPAGSPGIHLLQHFKGWEIETSDACFDISATTLMDFNVPQAGATAFMYLLPFNEKRALIEYTVFSQNLLEDADYEKVLKAYLTENFHLKTYRVLREEKGAIPMSSYNFPKQDGRIIYIGTAGGNTKPSTGYTFMFIQRHAERLVRSLREQGHPYLKEPSGARRFKWYDHTLLRILNEKKLEGKAVFKRLFERNPPQRVLGFLDEQTSLKDELQLTSRLQKRFFVPAALREITPLFKS